MGVGSTALLGPDGGVAVRLVLILSLPAYFARIACRRARLAANVSSTDGGDVINSSSGSG